MQRLALRDKELDGCTFVGRYWRRDGSNKVDLVLDDRPVRARSILAPGTIKWRERDAINAIPGATNALLVGVSRLGGKATGLYRQGSAKDLISAWQ